MEKVEETDRGWYMCQINTDPMISQKGFLEVVGESSFHLGLVGRWVRTWLTVLC